MKQLLTAIAIVVLLPISTRVSAQDFTLSEPSFRSFLWFKLCVANQCFGENLTLLPAETAPEPSIMLKNKMPLQRVKLSWFQCGPYWVPDPPPLFYDEDYTETFGQAVSKTFIETFADLTLGSVIEAIFSNNKKRRSK